eukprot:5553881-Amphidinium_carterae.1
MVIKGIPPRVIPQRTVLSSLPGIAVRWQGGPSGYCCREPMPTPPVVPACLLMAASIRHCFGRTPY